MITRKQYLDREATHDEYYSEIASLLYTPFTDAFLDRVRVALSEGDKHLNSIAMGTWDVMALSIEGSRVREVLKQRGDSYAPASGVCILKQAAREAATKESQV